MRSPAETLAHSRRHVNRAKQLVREQRARIEELRSEGHDTTEAEELLATLEATMRSMQEHLALEEKMYGQQKSGEPDQPSDEATKSH
jgi:hypothetical protein